MERPFGGTDLRIEIITRMLLLARRVEITKVVEQKGENTDRHFDQASPHGRLLPIVSA